MLARLISAVGAAVGLGNLFVYLLITPMIGGSAANGRVRNGHYYLGNHGRYTKVSAQTYWLNDMHGRSLVFTVPLGLMCLLGEDDDKYSPIGRNPI